MRMGLTALAAGSFGIGPTEFVIAGLLAEISAKFSVSNIAAFNVGDTIGPRRPGPGQAGRPVARRNDLRAGRSGQAGTDSTSRGQPEMRPREPCPHDARRPARRTPR